MNFDKLDNKSIRILNRVKSHLTRNKIENFKTFISEIDNNGIVDIDRFS